MDEAAGVSGDVEKDKVVVKEPAPDGRKREGKQKRRVGLEEFKREMLEGRSLHINRVPPATKKHFKELCAREFGDDYGVGLMYLLDRYEDFKMINRILEGHVELAKRMNQIECFLYDITHQPAEETEVIKHTLGGKKLVPIKRKEEAK